MELWLDYPALLYCGAAVLGLVVGSFLNVVILRMPRRLMAEWRLEAREILELPVAPEALPAGVAAARSACPNCDFQLRWYHNVPLLSFVLLRGRCARCKTPISWQYPLVELICAVLLMVCLWRFGPTAQFLAACVLTWFLIALAGIDFRTQLLPDQVTVPLLWLGLLLSLWSIFVDPAAAIVGAIVGYLILWSVFWLFKLVTGKEGMGYGDFKLLAALGAWLGWMQLPLVILLASVCGSLIGIGWLVVRKQSLPFAFGPYLAMAGWVAMVFGHDISAWYLARV
jgi:leader peptidase (prepilin peptidase)/N-methyltransferase